MSLLDDIDQLIRDIPLSKEDASHILDPVGFIVHELSGSDEEFVPFVSLAREIRDVGRAVLDFFRECSKDELCNRAANAIADAYETGDDTEFDYDYDDGYDYSSHDPYAYPGDPDYASGVDVSPDYGVDGWEYNESRVVRRSRRRSTIRRAPERTSREVYWRNVARCAQLIRALQHDFHVTMGDGPRSTLTGDTLLSLPQPSSGRIRIWYPPSFLDHVDYILLNLPELANYFLVVHWVAICVKHNQGIPPHKDQLVHIRETSRMGTRVWEFSHDLEVLPNV